MDYWGPMHSEIGPLYECGGVVDVISYLSNYLRKQMKIKGPKWKLDGRKTKQLLIHYEWMIEIMEQCHFAVVHKNSLIVDLMHYSKDTAVEVSITS